jgi:hypothetical protein
MKRLSLSFLFLFCLINLKAQLQTVSIGTESTNPRAILWLNGNGSQGLILPVANRTTITPTSEDAGMLIFDSIDKKLYFYSGTAWVEVGAGSTGSGSSTVVEAGSGLAKTGSGTASDPLTLSLIKGTTDGQIVKWNNTTQKWELSTDVSGGSPAVDDATIELSGAILQVKDGGITDVKISSVDPSKIGQAAATNGQVLTWNGTKWVPQDAGTGGSTTTLGNGEILIGNGSSNSAAALTGDATLSGATLTIEDDAITTNKIADETITTDDIEDGTIGDDDIEDASITIGKLAPSSATAGQVLKFVGGVWVAAADDTGTGTLPALTTSQLVSNNGTSNIAVTVGGDLSFNATVATNFTIKNNAVTAAKIATDAVDATKIADGSITGSDLNSAIAITTSGATSLTGTVSATGTTVTLNPSTTLALRGATWPAVNNVTGYLLNTSGALSWVAAPTSNLDAITDVTVTAPTDAQILIKNGAGDFTNRSVSGDIAMTNTGATSIANAAATGTNIITAINNAGTTGTVPAARIANHDAAKITTGTFGVARGGTGLGTAPTNGQLLIGNGTGYALSTLTQGTGITITNGAGTVTIASTGLSNPMNATGDIIYSSNASGTPASLPGAAGFLKSTGAAAPAWSAVNLASADVSGTLPLTAGGTGAITAATARTNLGLGALATLGAVGSTEITNASIADVDVAGAAAIAGTKISPNFGTQAITTSGNISTTGTGTLTVAGASTLSSTLAVTGGTTLSSLSGTGTRMVVADNAGLLSTQTIAAVVAPSSTVVRGNSGGTSQEASSIFDNSTFTGIGRTGPLTGAERFGFKADYGASAFGGMYIDANATGRPFYGYSTGSTVRSYHYIDGADGFKWKLYNGTYLTFQTDGSFGIDTETPGQKLSVASGAIGWGGTNGDVNVLTSAGSAELGGNDATANPSSGNKPYVDFHFGTGVAENYNARIINSADNEIQILTKSGGAITLSDTQVGIGTTNPFTNTVLDIVGANSLVDGTSGAFVDIQNKSNVTGALSGIRFSGSSLSQYKKTAIIVPYTQGSFGVSDMMFALNSANNTTTVGTSDSKMIIKSTGEVGIGTTTPDRLLDVEGTGYQAARITSTSFAGAGLELIRPGAGSFDYRIMNNATLRFQYGGSTDDDFTSATDLMTISQAGNVSITGSLSKGSGSFKIDHPLDPLNKYLYHSFVESPDMMNIYNGNITTDSNGDAVVDLPRYFAALNKDFRYQLTPIGQFAQVIILEEVDDTTNTFKIKSDKPNVKVSWQVTGVRKDAFAEMNRIPNEVEKTGSEKGTYLHPQAFGVSTTTQVSETGH